MIHSVGIWVSMSSAMYTSVVQEFIAGVKFFVRFDFTDLIFRISYFFQPYLPSGHSFPVPFVNSLLSVGTTTYLPTPSSRARVHLAIPFILGFSRVFPKNITSKYLYPMLSGHRNYLLISQYCPGLSPQLVQCHSAIVSVWRLSVFYSGPSLSFLGPSVTIGVRPAGMLTGPFPLKWLLNPWLPIICHHPVNCPREYPKCRAMLLQTPLWTVKLPTTIRKESVGIGILRDYVFGHPIYLPQPTQYMVTT